MSCCDFLLPFRARRILTKGNCCYRCAVLHTESVYLWHVDYILCLTSEWLILKLCWDKSSLGDEWETWQISQLVGKNTSLRRLIYVQEASMTYGS